MVFNDKHRESIRKSVLCWLATATVDGYPNVSPKEVFCCYEDNKILIANIASPGSLKNIISNNKVCVSVVDILSQKGSQFKGRAEVHKKGDAKFNELSQPLLTITKGLFPFSSLFLIEVEKAKEILAPRYWMFPETTEEEQIESAKKLYGF